MCLIGWCKSKKFLHKRKEWYLVGLYYRCVQHVQLEVASRKENIYEIRGNDHDDPKLRPDISRGYSRYMYYMYIYIQVQTQTHTHTYLYCEACDDLWSYEITRETWQVVHTRLPAWICLLLARIIFIGATIARQESWEVRRESMLFFRVVNIIALPRFQSMARRACRVWVQK